MKKMKSFFMGLISACALATCLASNADIPSNANSTVKVHKDILWAQPNGFKLTLDIYEPKTKKKAYPVLIIFHGGGWLLNSKSIMDNMAEYMAKNGDLVVVNANYRLLGDNNNTTTANELVEDAMGVVLWVKDNIKQYRGNPEKVAVTGDSAGGHLASMVMLAGRQLEADRFEGNSLGFAPTYLPKNMTPEKIAQKDGLKIQAVILSYTAFDLQQAAKNGFETANNPFWKYADVTPRGLFGKNINVESRPEFYRAVSPINYIPNAKQYQLPPQFVLVGSEDSMTTPKIAQSYVNKLKQAKQTVEFKIYPGKGHGFLDSGCPNYMPDCFQDRAPKVLDDMIIFLKKSLPPNIALGF